MRVPSPEETSSWFPDLVVDRIGRVHVVWCETDHRAMANLKIRDDALPEAVYYSTWDGNQWAQPNDIVPPQKDIIRTAIAVDDYNMLHLLFDFSPPFGLYYKQAHADLALSAAAWTPPRLVNSRGGTYMSDVGIFEDTLHIVYDDRGADEGECPLCADIYYRRSTDRGLTWSVPLSLFATGTGSSRAQMEVDKTGTLHVARDEGWDRLSGRGDPEYGIYTFSVDGGNTWADPTIVQYPDSNNVQLSVGSDGQGGVMLVWRTTQRQDPSIYYMWSADQGESWSSPGTLPNIIARPWDVPFDMYDMATDSMGYIHLLVVGREFQDSDALLGVYHLIWDGAAWSRPTRIYAAEGMYPEYPKIVVYGGNQFHGIWFTREGSVWDNQASRLVWYSSGQSSAPHQPATPVPTFTPLPPTATPNPTPTVTPYPTLSSTGTGLPDGLRTDKDDAFRLAIALSPIVLIVLVAMVVRVGRFGKSR